MPCYKYIKLYIYSVINGLVGLMVIDLMITYYQKVMGSNPTQDKKTFIIGLHKTPVTLDQVPTASM